MESRERGRVAMIWRVMALAGLMAGTAHAQEVLDGAGARGLLFNERRTEVAIITHGFVSEAEVAVLRDAAAKSVPYYGAIAAAPDLGITGEATSATGNFHDAPAAAAAALAECNAKRPRGSAACVVVAEIRPRNWQARALQLSAGATSVFKRDYRRGGGERAFAVSPTSGGFGFARGEGAAAKATRSCNTAGHVADCRVVVQD
jgi:hypothetical protein